jgi:hypothetical protein
MTQGVNRSKLARMISGNRCIASGSGMDPAGHQEYFEEPGVGIVPVVM